MTTTILLCGVALGMILHGPVHKAWRKMRRTEDKIRGDGEKAAFARGKAEGVAESLSVLVDTDENAAIIEALGRGVLYQSGAKKLESAVEEEVAKVSRSFGYSMWGLYAEDRSWTWQDKAMLRAGLSTTALTPRRAYQLYVSQRSAAKVICEQLDELERVRKEAGK